MTIEQELLARSDSACELCGQTAALSVYPVPPKAEESVDTAALLCDTCKAQIEGTLEVNVHHWRCLNDSMWSPVPAVQVLAWRMLTRLRGEGWPQDLLDMLYLEDGVLEWARATGEGDSSGDSVKHMDANGARLQNGDTVTLVKDLNVKGTSFTAKRGTAVRNITLVQDNPEQIEGRVNGQLIVILTKFVKKS